MSDFRNLYVISGASGAGKTTLCLALQKELGFFFSVSATTRPKRPGETEGKDYFFISEEEFERRVNEAQFLEWASVHGYRYGTPLKPIEDHLKNGEKVLLDIDTQGALYLKRKFSQIVLIFIETPTLQELENRLIARGTDSREVIEKRIRKAREEISQSSQYDYVVINEDLEKAKRELMAIIQGRQGFG